MSKRFVGYRTRQQRRDQRRTHPVLRFAIGARTYDSVDWCLGGTLLADYDGAFVPEQKLRVDVVGCVGETPTPRSISARVVRVEPATRRLALAFERLTPEAYSYLERLILRPGSEAPRADRIPA